MSLLLKAQLTHQLIAEIICETQNGESNIRRRLSKKLFPSETLLTCFLGLFMVYSYICRHILPNDKPYAYDEGYILAGIATAIIFVERLQL